MGLERFGEELVRLMKYCLRRLQVHRFSILPHLQGEIGQSYEHRERPNHFTNSTDRVPVDSSISPR